MNSLSIMAVGFVALGGTLFGQAQSQPPALGYKDTYQADYLDIRGTVNFTNAGAHASPQNPLISSDICVNAYVFQPITGSPDGPLGAALATCCTCRVAPNTVRSITPIISGPVIVKLIATLPQRFGPGCDATVVPSTDVGVPGGYAAGMRATSVTQPTVLSDQLSTQNFDKLPLGGTEQTKVTQLCIASASRCTCQ